MSTATAQAPCVATPPQVPDQQLFIDGKFVTSAAGKTFTAIDPSTGKTICQVAEASAADVDRAVQAARKALESGPWKKMSATQRGELMFKLADLVEQQAEELAVLESYNSGKTIAHSRGDVAGVAAWFRYYAGFADKIEGRSIPQDNNTFSYTLRQPVGVVGQIIPWNFPLLMLAWKWAPALACGNTIVMKLAEQTPLTGLKMAELARQAGFPDGVINVLNGMGETTGAAIVEHPGIDKIAFTGHVDTAKIIQKAAAHTLKRCTFELGGKSPNVIFADADLPKAVACASEAIFFNAGQCCTAGSRLFVERSIQQEFVEELAKVARQRRLGNPLDSATEQGPQVSREQFDKILGYVEKGRQEGAELVTGGNRFGDEGFFIEPTIFNQVSDEMTIARDEIFGPVVSVLPFEDMHEMLDRANDTYYGLAAAIWTKDIDKAHLYAREVKAGTVWINCYHQYSPLTPFGGFKMSGNGRENGEAVLDHYTETKTVTIKLHPSE
ncbi:MAG: aldehyde dehydrogenase family protein [Planctomycetaceae bacterium]|nr:aldehyde dehydrogenase family protein [Planctomycetaceae bacterium]